MIDDSARIARFKRTSTHNDVMVHCQSSTNFIFLILRHDTHETVHLEDFNRKMFSLQIVSKLFLLVLMLTLRHKMKKSIVNNVPVSGSNFKLPKITTTKKCTTATKMSRVITKIHGTRNSRWSFFSPMKTRIDERVPRMAQPRNSMLNSMFAVVKYWNN